MSARSPYVMSVCSETRLVKLGSGGSSCSIAPVSSAGLPAIPRHLRVSHFASIGSRAMTSWLRLLN